MVFSLRNFKDFSLAGVLTLAFFSAAWGIGPPFAYSQEQEEKPSNLQKFLQFEEKLKTAVCDESVLSRAPNLESLGKASNKKPNLFWVPLEKDYPEKRLLAFLLGDTLTGVYSSYLETSVNSPAEEKQGVSFLERQSRLASLKRKVTLEICQALVQSQLWQTLLDTKPSRFLQAFPSTKDLGEKSTFLQVIDSEGRFGFSPDESYYLIPGWVQPFEVDRVYAHSRVYRRFSNPLTNQTQSIQVLSPNEVPLGVLFVSAEESPLSWEDLVIEAKKQRAQEVQVETYRMMIENDAIKALQRNPKNADSVRKLQEFYKNLLQAYLIFPDEKQFEAFGRQQAPGFTFQEVHEKYLTDGFLKMLRSVSVNGGSVRLGLFRPDARLNAIYAEFKKKIERLGR